MEQIKAKIEKTTGIIELYNPPHNFMTGVMVRELDLITREWEKNAGVRAIVITGGLPGIFITHYSVDELVSGFAAFVDTPPAVKNLLRLSSRGFAGFYRMLDLLPGVRDLIDKALAGTRLEGLANLERVHRVFCRLGLMNKAVIAAVNGEALGGGCELALSCDYRLMARGDFRIGLVEALAGIIPGAGGTQRMARLLGPETALQLILEGKVLSPEEALEIGLVDRLTEPDRLWDEALELAETLARRPAWSVRGVKRAIRQGANLPLRSAIQVEKAMFVDTGFTEDARRAGEYYQERFSQGAKAREIFDSIRKGEGPDFSGK